VSSPGRSSARAQQAASSSSPSSSSSCPAPSAGRSPQWTYKRCEVGEWQTLTLGPFEAGVVCEIVRAWYGVKGDPERQIEVTAHVRNRWDAEQGLKLHSFNGLFSDPARLRMKTLCVEYRLSNVRTWDVSRGNFTEGVGTVGLLPVIVTKALSNILGATAAAGGYVMGKAVVSVKRTLGSDSEANVADSEIFQAGFKAWLLTNGIIPSVTYDPGGYGSSDMKQTPLIVANHMCYLDGMVLAAFFGAPKVLAMEGTLKTPLIGHFAEEIGVIEVNRTDKASRTATMEAIVDHVKQWTPGSRPLLLFPEGTTSNGDAILQFKKGAFVPGAPVRPVVLTYTGSWHPANTNFKTSSSGELEQTGDLEWCEQFLGHLIHSMQVRVLCPYLPNEQEQTDAQLYANNVQVIMSEAYERLRTDADRRREEREQNSWQANLQRFTGRLLGGLDNPRSALPPSHGRSRRASGGAGRGEAAPQQPA